MSIYKHMTFIVISTLIYVHPSSATADEGDLRPQKIFFDAIVKNDLKTIESFIEKDPSIVDKPIKYYNLPVLEAARAGSLDALKLFVSRGADINKTDARSGNNVLHMLVTSKSKEDKLDHFLAYLLDEKKMSIESRNKAGQTPFIYAFAYGAFVPPPSQATPVIEVFDKFGADLNAQDKSGRTALHYLVSTFNCPGEIDLAKWSEPARLLIQKKGVDVNIMDSDKRTPLLAFLVHAKNAEDSKKLDLVKSLMENGAKVSVKSKKGEKPLDYADRKGELYKMLRKKYPPRPN